MRIVLFYIQKREKRGVRKVEGVKVGDAFAGDRV